MSKQQINIVWFKRDLRFIDNEALYNAVTSNLPVLLVYVFEPSIMNYHDSDARHWRFIFQSITDLKKQLKNNAERLYFFYNEADVVFKSIIEQFDVKQVFSYQETGNKLTFDRDIVIKQLLINTKFAGMNIKQMVLSESLKTGQTGKNVGNKKCLISCLFYPIPIGT